MSGDLFSVSCTSSKGEQNMDKKTKQKYEMKPLEEMDLIDDFLFTEVMADENNGQRACRIILETVLKRRLGKISFDYQKTVPGISESSHGIRMDAFIKEVPLQDSQDDTLVNVYDIEPDKKEDKKKELPKRSRYYGDLVDVQLLQTGIDYEELPDLITIFILSYDPFGEDAMYYEAGTIIKTHPHLRYNDGIRKIFLYTDGKLPKNADEDDKKIRNLLRYIKHSTDDNVTDETTGELSRIVKSTKSKKDVGVRYMKSWERERELREEGKEEERVNTERERKRADDAEARADEAEAELARYKAKYGDLQ